MNYLISQKELQSKLTEVFESLDLKLVNLIDMAKEYDGGRYLNFEDLTSSRLADFLSTRLVLTSTIALENFIKEILANNAPNCLVEYNEILKKQKESINNKKMISSTIRKIKINKVICYE